MRKLLTLIAIALPMYLFGQPFQEVSEDVFVLGTFGEAGFFGGGVSFVDFDGDGWDDLSFASDNGQTIHLFKNNAGTFVALPALVTYTGVSRQLLWVDYDNDGDKDLFIAAFGAQNRLYRNDSGFTLTDMTAASGIHNINDLTVCASFCDVDRDGWLDLYVGNYEFGHTNYLYRNNGDGTFSDYTATAGVGDGQQLSLASAFLDYDDDGDADLFIANDKGNANSFYENNGSGIFTDVSVSSGIHMVFDAMNAGVGDCDMDGLMDIYVTNGPAGNVLYRNNGNGTFSNIASSAGVTMNKVCWGGNFFDFDNDRDLDLYVCAANTPGNQTNLLYQNNGSGFFTPFPSGGFSGDDLPSFSNAIGDFNNDGRLDIAVSNDEDEPFQLWRNDHATGNHWAKVRLVGTDSNRDGIGSKLDFRFGGQRLVQQTYCGIGFESQNSTLCHVGLGAYDHIDSLFVFWPSGTIDLFEKLSANQTTVLIEGSSDFEAPLPLSLDYLNVRATVTGVQIDWRVFHTLGVDRHALQRSSDGRLFSTKYEVEMERESQNPTTFSWMDGDAQLGQTYYYRLASIDRDGDVEYSPTKVVRLADRSLEALSYTSMVGDGQLRFSFTQATDATHQVDILGLNGVRYGTFQLRSPSSSQDHTINVSHLSPGLYYAIISNGQSRKALRFFKA